MGAVAWDGVGGEGRQAADAGDIGGQCGLARAYETNMGGICDRENLPEKDRTKKARELYLCAPSPSLPFRLLALVLSPPPLCPSLKVPLSVPKSPSPPLFLLFLSLSLSLSYSLSLSSLKKHTNTHISSSHFAVIFAP
jgi:hypothetical protein